MPENTSDRQQDVYSMVITILQSSFPAWLWVSQKNTAFAARDSLDLGLGLKNPQNCSPYSAVLTHGSGPDKIQVVCC